MMISLQEHLAFDWHASTYCIGDYCNYVGHQILHPKVLPWNYCFFLLYNCCVNYTCSIITNRLCNKKSEAFNSLLEQSQKLPPLSLFFFFFSSFSVTTSKKWYNGLVVKALDSQSRSPKLKTTEWLQGQLSLLSFRGR